MGAVYREQGKLTEAVEALRRRVAIGRILHCTDLDNAIELLADVEAEKNRI